MGASKSNKIYGVMMSRDFQLSASAMSAGIMAGSNRDISLGIPM
jgi:hypothetical protein